MKKLLFTLAGLAVLLSSCEFSRVNLYMSSENINLQVGRSARLHVMLLSDTLAANEVNWSSSNPDVAMVADGLVLGLSGGEAVITARAMGASAATKVTVESTDTVPVEAFLMNHSELTLLPTQRDTLVATYLTGEPVEHAAWHTTNNLIVHVDENGVITAIQKGTAIISALLMEENKKYVGSCVVTVKEAK